MNRTGLVSAFAVVVAMSSAAMAQTPPPKPIDYDSLCKLDKSGPRRVAWMATTPASRAETVKTQVERWREMNRSRLSAKQLVHLDEVLASITPLTYAEGKDGDLARQQAQRVSKMTPGLFTMDEMRGMSVVDGTCISSKK